MNLPPEEPAPFDDAALEREWRAQEAALLRERLLLDPAGEQGRDRQYRRLARMLGEPLPEQLPPDFASRVAVRATAPVGRFEYALLLGLMLALLLVAGVLVVNHAERWAEAFGALAPAADSSAGGRLVALGGCLAASWWVDLWTRRRAASVR